MATVVSSTITPEQKGGGADASGAAGAAPPKRSALLTTVQVRQIELTSIRPQLLHLILSQAANPESEVLSSDINVPTTAELKQMQKGNFIRFRGKL